MVVNLICCAKTPRKRDSCWSWITCAAGSFAWALTFGFVNCYAVIMPVLMDQYKGSREATAWAGSIPQFITFAGIPISSKVVSRIDIRFGAMLGASMCLSSLVVTSFAQKLIHVIFSFSILYGMGSSMLFTSIVFTMTRYFKKREGVALGIISGGINLGVLTLGPLVQLLLDQYDLKSMFRIIASIFVVVMLVLLTFDPNVERETIEVRELENGEQQELAEIGFFTGLKLLRKRPIFIICVCSLALQTLTAFVTHVHLVSYCKEVGIPPSKSANLFIAIGLSSLISAITSGRVIDIPSVNPIHVNQVGALLMALSMIFVQLATEYYHFVIYSVFLGLGAGILVTTIVLLLLNSVEPRLRFVSFPFGQMITATGNLIGPPLIGFIADKVGSYKPAFYTAGGICLAAFFLCFLQYCFKSWREEVAADNIPESEKILLGSVHETEQNSQLLSPKEASQLPETSPPNDKPSNNENHFPREGDANVDDVEATDEVLSSEEVDPCAKEAEASENTSKDITSMEPHHVSENGNEKEASKVASQEEMNETHDDTSETVPLNPKQENDG